MEQFITQFSALLPTLVFTLFASVVIFSGVMVIASKNSVHSVLFLILAFFNAAGLFVLIGAEFIAMMLVIVYVGAVAVLFLFVVMMLNVNFEEMREGFQKYLGLGLMVASVLLAELVLVIYWALQKPTATASVEHATLPGISNTANIGNLLYTYYVYPFQLAGLILLVAMIGAIVLTLRTRPGVRKQKISAQLARTKEQSVKIVKVETGKGI
ncbi:MAG: NADH-quinone oxidoreductase subunit J [Alphaproteobacteria bacterium]|nr:NADH-quinone oxidoreductase subunit J [Alphaproteobacteria bacterium]